MNRLPAVALALCLALDSAWALAAPRLPPPRAETVWTYITRESPYLEWGHWEDHPGVHLSRSPHGPYNRVYVNQAGLASTKTPVNYGTIQVKTSQTKQGKIKGITVMYKVKGYNPQAGDWFWAQYTPKGRVLEAGKPAECIRCHGALGDNDYLIVHQPR